MNLFLFYQVYTEEFFRKTLEYLIKSRIFAKTDIKKHMSYLKIPIDIKSAVSGKLERCSYEESIAQQIMLLIVSRYGEVVGKENYGSVIWELEFSQLVKISDWENKVQESLLQAITTYEERLKDISVSVALSEIDDENKKETHVRRKAQIAVRGKIISTDQPFYFSTLVYISPLSQ